MERWKLNLVQPMKNISWEQLKEFIKGKVFLVGITFLDSNESIIGKAQTHGKVLELTDQGIIRIMRDDESVFQIPYDPETIKSAVEGDYKEKSSGLVISDPGYITTWEVSLNKNNSIENFMKYGFRV